MQSEDTIWRCVETVVRQEGFELFDLELPGGHSRALKIFVASANKDINSVNLDQCARISRKLDEVKELEAALPDSCVLEVSSPGINRKLRLPQHFEQALGERVKLTLLSRRIFRDTALVGKLEGFKNEQLSVREEQSGEIIDVPLSEVKKARVDFKFDV